MEEVIRLAKELKGRIEKLMFYETENMKPATLVEIGRTHRALVELIARENEL